LLYIPIFIKILEGYMDDLKQKVQAIINKKQLSSIMNNIKWELLQKTIKATLQFPPLFQVKYVLEDTPFPENFEDDVWYWGEWNEQWNQGLRPFYKVEWIRVRPRYVNHRGSLIEPEIIDFTNEFVAMLQKIRIPFVKEDGKICICGYVKSTEVFS
ncbi:MAG: DUF6678 family protein, partial [Neobacillus sp.]